MRISTRALALGCMGLALGLGLVARAAFGASATLTSLGQGLYNTVQGTLSGNPETLYFTGVLHIRIDGGPETNSYCVDIQHGISFGDTEPQVPPTYPCAVLYILNNAFPTANNIPGALADQNREAAAVQAAIWSLTDPFVPTAPSDVVARAGQIVSAASSHCGSLPPVPQSITVTPASATNFLPTDTTHGVTATLLDTNGAPIASYPLKIVVTGASGPQTFTGATDAGGSFAVTYTNTFGVTGSDTITASASFTVPVGLEFKLPAKQGIVLAGPPATGTVTGTAAKNWAPARCGDGVVNQAGEECDDGNQVNGDGCDNNCTVTRCGNGIVDPGEQCDDGNQVNSDGCEANCTLPTCGNGILDAGEQCDDGARNGTPGDGCSSSCRSTEICNDLLDNDGDGLVDCEDPDCGPCPPIQRDPAAIVLRPGRTDLLKIQGGITPSAPLDPASVPTGLLMTNANGVIYRVVLPAGALQPIGHGHFRYTNKLAPRSPTGGLYKIDMFLRDGIWHLKIAAYADLSAATLPTMAAQFLAGEQVYLNKSEWRRRANGWHLAL
jgi:cysteine-rich repeat protein